VTLTSTAAAKAVNADDHDGVTGPGVIQQRGKARPFFAG
jgi:hypothetical protein